MSERTKGLGTENAFEVLGEVKELMRQGKDIVSFCIGQPDFVTPDNIRDAGIKAIKEGKTDYTPSQGMIELRNAIAEFESKRTGVEYDAGEVVVDAGAKPFIGYTVLSVTDFGKGHEVIYPRPGYPIYESQIVAHGCKPVQLNLLEEKAFSFDVEELKEKVNKNTRLLIINSPQNPTGGILSKADLKAIADLAEEFDFWIFSDEIYTKIIYEKKVPSIVSIEGMKERTILSSGVSKTYSMTGWRIGYALNKPLIKHLTRWVTNTTSCAAHMSQYAAMEALKGPQEEAEKMRKSFQERRDLIVKGLNDIEGIHCLSPGGTFYVYPNTTEACKLVGAKNAEEFRKRLLNDAGVAVLADIHFGAKNPSEGEHSRLSFATSKENIKEGLGRIKEYIEKNKK
ncbi:MAG: pyridoxal phosphate-dependent aminotransferase [archaeon]